MSDDELFLADIDKIKRCYEDTEKKMTDLDTPQHLLPVILMAVKSGKFLRLRRLCSATKPAYIDAYKYYLNDGEVGIDIDMEKLPQGNTTSTIAELTRLLQV
jgi:hypothetical protein